LATQLADMRRADGSCQSAIFTPMLEFNEAEGNLQEAGWLSAVRRILRCVSAAA
jgi:hypothetical protein